MHFRWGARWPAWVPALWPPARLWSPSNCRRWLWEHRTSLERERQDQYLNEIQWGEEWHSYIRELAFESQSTQPDSILIKKGFDYLNTVPLTLFEKREDKSSKVPIPCRFMPSLEVLLSEVYAKFRSDYPPYPVLVYAKFRSANLGGLCQV